MQGLCQEPSADGNRAKRFSLRLLGTPQVQQQGHEIHLGTRKALALLACLALRRQPVSRNELDSLLWPEHDEKRARRNLRNELLRLHHVLGTDAIVGSHDIQLNPDAVTVDAWQFEVLLTQGQDEEALALYHGPLLEAFFIQDAEPFESWLESQREKLQDAYLAALAKLAEQAESTKDYARGLSYCRRAIATDPFAEPFYLQAMRLSFLMGDRNSALFIYRTLEGRLWDELRLKPSEELSALAQRLVARPPSSSTPVRLPLFLQHPNTFVGRVAELEQLRACLTEVEGGVSQVVVVTGPAGIGKTRLLEEVVVDQSHVWCRARGSTSLQSYFPVFEGLREFQERVGMSAVDPGWSRNLGQHMPEYDHTVNQTYDENKTRLWLLESLTRSLLNAAGTGGVLIFDDLHWADSETIGLFEHLAWRSKHTPMLLVGLYRPDEVTHHSGLQSLLPALKRTRLLTRIDLPEFNKQESQELLEVCLLEASVTTHEWLPEFSQHIYQAVGGNPLYLLESLRLELSRRANPTRDSPTLIMGREQFFERRLAELPVQHRQVLEAMAVFGKPVNAVVLAAITERGMWELAASLEQLLRHKLIVSQGENVAFAHEVMREATYRNIPRSQRQLLHTHVAEVLKQVYEGELDTISSQLARHYERAGLPTQAVPFHFRAAAWARKRFAHHTAVYHYRRLWARLPSAESIPILLKLGYVLNLIGKANEAETIYRKALMLADRHNNLRLFAQCQQVLGEALREKQEHDEAEALMTQALQSYEQLGDQVGISRTLRGLGKIHWDKGNVERALEQLRRGARAATKARAKRDLALIVCLIGRIFRAREDYTKALTCFRYWLRVAEGIGDTQGVGLALGDLSQLYRQTGALESAWHSAQRQLSIATKMGDMAATGHATLSLGLSYLSGGDYARAFTCFMHSTSIFCRLRATREIRLCLGRIVCTLLLLGRLDEANQFSTRCEPFMRSAPLSPLLAEFLYLRGRIHVQLGVSCYREALGLAEEAQNLAAALGDKRLTFEARLLVLVLQGRLGMSHAMDKLKQLLAEGLSDEEETFVHLALIQSDSEYQHDRSTTGEPFQKLHAGALNAGLRWRYEMLAGKPLGAPVSLPELPRSIKSLSPEPESFTVLEQLEEILELGGVLLLTQEVRGQKA